MEYLLDPIGIIHSPLKSRQEAPMQGYLGAPAAIIELYPDKKPALTGLQPGDRVVVLTWLHQTDRTTLQVHPRGDLRNPLTGVFATRSPDRPNPIGIHPVRIVRITDLEIEVEPIEAIDGTPVLDIKPVLRQDASKPSM